MNIDGKAYRTIWVAEDGWSVNVIDQTRLPHELAILTLKTADDAAHAIKSMQVRGAPLIGATAAYGVCLALREDASDEAVDKVIAMLAAQRPTAINLRWALEEMRNTVRNIPREKRVAAAYERAAELCDDDGKNCVTSTGQRHFCKRCASALWLFDPEWSDLVHPFASAIDTDLPKPPQRTHLMLRYKASWVEPAIGKNDLVFDEYPKQSIEDWHKSHGLWID